MIHGAMILTDPATFLYDKNVNIEPLAERLIRLNTITLFNVRASYHAKYFIC